MEAEIKDQLMTILKSYAKNECMGELVICEFDFDDVINEIMIELNLYY